MTRRMLKPSPLKPCASQARQIRALRPGGIEGLGSLYAFILQTIRIRIGTDAFSLDMSPRARVLERSATSVHASKRVTPPWRKPPRPPGPGTGSQLGGLYFAIVLPQGPYI